MLVSLFILARSAQCALARHQDFGGQTGAARVEHLGSNSGRFTTASESPWRQIIPTKHLVWRPCYESAFQCARLEVPLNYSEPNGTQAAIALIRRRAEEPEDSPSYRGPVLFNPGGPGDSGVDMVLNLGEAYANILGPQFDIVGFDPRGIARSIPKAIFFNTDVERQMFGASAPLIPRIVNGSVRKAHHTWGRARLTSALAEQRNKGYLEHLTTENTATDMLTIARAHGSDMVQYWGVSYGTTLGVTFAAMYPDKIGRFVLDGVADSEDYYSDSLHGSSLGDIDKAMQLFFDTCADAGPDSCPFYSESPDDIRGKLTVLYERVRREPVPVVSDTAYGLVDYDVLRNAVFLSLYTPYRSFQPLALALADLEAGDGSTLFFMYQGPPYECSCNAHEHDFDTTYDGGTTILCNDAAEMPMSLRELEDKWSQLLTISGFGDIWGQLGPANCVGWPKNGKPFRGPFVGDTSHPILFIGNTADPVTPLAGAIKMAQGFKNSIVLTIDGGGHTSRSAPSLCAQQYVRQYFQNGTLPDTGTICQPDTKNPFLYAPSAQHATTRRSVEDAEDGNVRLLHAMEELSELSSIPSIVSSLRHA